MAFSGVKGKHAVAVRTLFLDIVPSLLHIKGRFPWLSAFCDGVLADELGNNCILAFVSKVSV